MEQKIAEKLSGESPDDDEGVRRAYVTALLKIAGPMGVRALSSAAQKDESEAVRYDALVALLELLLELRSEPSPGIHGPSAIQCKGAALPRTTHGLIPEVQKEIRNAFVGVSENEDEKEYLKHIAAKGVAFFKA